MTLYRAFDASVPPPGPFPGSDAVMGYLGPETNTPHVWSVAEWQRFAALRQFPIWVGAGRTNGPGDGTVAADMMHSLGWKPFAAVRRFLIVDMESEVNPEYVNGLADAVNSAGYDTVVYESESAVDGNPVRSGIWLADWNGIASIPRIPGVIAVQYYPDLAYAGTQIDLSVISEDMLAHGGEGPRH